ncbi:MAG: tetratricopeptide repeat protein [Acidobacteriota bacterium]
MTALAAIIYPMSTQVPIVRQILWIAMIPQFAAMVVAIVVASRFSPSNGFLYGAGSYLLYSVGARHFITRDHRAGIALVKQQRLEDAIARFQKSLEFLNRNSWIDRFRSIVLMSPSAASFREMALANIGFCYSQMGRGEEARTYYKKCLDLFPNSGLAAAALRMIDSSPPKYKV